MFNIGLQLKVRIEFCYFLLISWTWLLCLVCEWTNQAPLAGIGQFFIQLKASVKRKLQEKCSDALVLISVAKQNVMWRVTYVALFIIIFIRLERDRGSERFTLNISVIIVLFFSGNCNWFYKVVSVYVSYNSKK